MQDNLDINIIISMFDEKEGLIPSYFSPQVSRELAEEIAMASLTHSFLGTTTSTGDLILPFSKVKQIAFIYFYSISDLRKGVIIRASISLLFPENKKSLLYEFRSKLFKLTEAYTKRINIEAVDKELIEEYKAQIIEELALRAPLLHLPSELSFFQYQLTKQQLQLLKDELQKASWSVMVAEDLRPDFMEFSQTLLTLASQEKLPQAPEMYHLLMITTILKGRFKECLEIYQKAEKWGFSPEMAALYAFCLFRTGKILEAIDIWEHLRSLDQLSQTTRVQVLSFLSEVYLMRGNPNLSIELAKAAFQIAEEEGSAATLPAYHALSYYYILNGEYTKSGEILQEALKVVEQVGDRYWKAWLLDKLAFQTYYQGGGTSETNLLFYEAFEYFKELDNHHAQAIVNFHIGDIWRIQGQFDLAFKQLTNSLEIIEEYNDSFTRAQILCNLGTLFSKKDTHRSLDYFREANILAEEMHDNYAIINSLLGIADALKRLAEYDSALKHLKTAQTLSQQISDKKNLIRAQVEIGEIYLLLNEPARAEGWITSAVSSLEILNLEEELVIRAHLLLARIHSYNTNFKQASEHIDLAERIANKLNSPEYKQKCQNERDFIRTLQSKKDH
ncbi:MAG: tetratricopeptide repeat protein [Candidatus Hermodarchaeota archaeon]